jgi:hypothetical protein
MVPYPGLYNQAQNLAMQQLQAYLGSVTRSSRRETRAGNRFIRGLAHSFANELGAIGSGVGATFDDVQRQQAASDASISNYLTGGGQQLMQDIGQQLSYAPQETQDAFAGGQTKVGTSLAQQAAGYSAQKMKQVLGAEGSERAFGQMLPGIGALSGIQAAKSFQQSQARTLAAQRDSILSQAPQLTAQLYSTFAQQAQSQAEMAQQARFHSQDLAQRRLETGVTMGGEDQKRLDTADQTAFEMIGNLVTGPGRQPLQGPNRLKYPAVFERVAAMYRSHFTGRSDTWIKHRTELALKQWGYDPNAYAIEHLFGQAF